MRVHGPVHGLTLHPSDSQGNTFVPSLNESSWSGSRLNISSVRLPRQYICAFIEMRVHGPVHGLTLHPSDCQGNTFVPSLNESSWPGSRLNTSSLRLPREYICAFIEMRVHDPVHGLTLHPSDSQGNTFMPMNESSSFCSDESAEVVAVVRVF